MSLWSDPKPLIAPSKHPTACSLLTSEVLSLEPQPSVLDLVWIPVGCSNTSAYGFKS